MYDLLNDPNCVQDLHESESLTALKERLPEAIKDIKLVDGLFYLHFWPLSPEKRDFYTDLYSKSYQEDSFPWDFIWDHLYTFGLDIEDALLLKQALREFTEQHDLIKKYMVLVAAFLSVISEEQKILTNKNDDEAEFCVVFEKHINIFKTCQTSFCYKNNIYLNGEMDGDWQHIESVAVYGPTGTFLNKEALQKRLLALSFFHEMGHSLVKGLEFQHEIDLWESLFLDHTCPDWKKSDIDFSNYLLESFKILREILSNNELTDEAKTAHIDEFFQVMTGQDSQQFLVNLYRVKTKNLIKFTRNLFLEGYKPEEVYKEIVWHNYFLNVPEVDFFSSFQDEFFQSIKEENIKNLMDLLIQKGCWKPLLEILQLIASMAIKVENGQEGLNEDVLEDFSPIYSAFINWKEAYQITGLAHFSNSAYLNMFSDAILSTYVGGFIRIIHDETPKFSLQNPTSSETLEFLPAEIQEKIKGGYTTLNKDFDKKAIKDIVICTYSILDPSFNFDEHFDEVKKLNKTSNE